MLDALRWLAGHWWLIAAGGGLVVVATLFGRRAGIALALSILTALVYRRGRRDGAEAIERRDQKRRDYLQEHYDEIDRRPLDPRDAYRRLRDRSGGE